MSSDRGLQNPSLRDPGNCESLTLLRYLSPSVPCNKEYYLKWTDNMRGLCGGFEPVAQFL